MTPTFTVSILRIALIAAVFGVGGCDRAAPPVQLAHDASHAPASAPQSSPPAMAPAPQPKPRAPVAASGVPRGYEGALPALPRTTFPPPRPAQVVAAVYEFAARHPEVLHHVPCFCGCESHGHVGNDDCFVAARDADGRPRWDVHGMG